MNLLHPIFMFTFVFLLIGSYIEVYSYEKKQPFFTWIGAVLIIIGLGLRIDAGADYPVYKQLFVGFSIYTDYGDVWDKALFRENAEQIEWIFVLINKLIFDFGFPFHIVTLVMAIITITLKFSSIYKNVAYPALAILFYFMPIAFFEDGGQMRQGLGIAVCVYSFRFIKNRNLLMYLVCMYLALGFHKTAIIFVPAYWVVLVPMNRSRIVLVLAVALLLSPLELYRLAGGFFDSITPNDVSKAYTGYLDDRYYGQEVESGLNDVVKLLWVLVLVKYDKRGCENVWWYEYMRNLAVFGLALFYFFRANSIFAVRLPGAYMFFLTMFCLPNLVYALKDETKRYIYTGFILYLGMMFFYFGNGNGYRGRFGFDNYKNALWK